MATARIPASIPPPIAVLLLALGAWQPATAAEEDTSDDGLSTIIVTGQKVAQDLQQAPASIAVVTNEQLDRDHIATTDALERYAPNVTITYAYVNIRGIGTDAPVSFEPSIGFYVDGVDVGHGQNALAPMLDLAQVEVIRGPQSSLLGKSAIAGAISLTTNSAEPGADASGSIQLLRGALDENGVKASASIPLGDDFALRLAGVRDHRDGYLDNTAVGRRDNAQALDGARAKLSWTPDGRWSGWLSVEAGRRRDRGEFTQLTQATPATLALFQAYDPQTETRLDDQTSTDAMPNDLTHRSRLAIAHAELALDTATITSVSGGEIVRAVGSADDDFTAMPIVNEILAEDYHLFSQELRIQGTWGSLDYIAGGVVLFSNLRVTDVLFALPDGSAGLATGLAAAPVAMSALLDRIGPGVSDLDRLADQSGKDLREHDRSGGLFTQLTWHFAERWSLAGALRWSDEHKRADAANRFEHEGIVFRALLGEQAYDVRRSRHESDVSPRFALQYTWSDDVMLYATQARGFKSGAFNVNSATSDALEFGPERSSTVEAGAKATLLDRHLSIDLAVFDTHYHDIQLGSFDGRTFRVQNAAAARIRGAELSSRWQLGPHWSGIANLGLLHARFTSYPDAQAPADPDAPAGTGPTTQDLSGRPLEHAPSCSAALGALFESTVWNSGLSFSAGLEAAYRAREYLELDLDPIDVQPAFWRFDGTLGLGSADGRWHLGVLGLNLADRRIRYAGGDLPLFVGDHFAGVAPPRQWMATVDWQW
jgi:iron complex outermembrane receptor protein